MRVLLGSDDPVHFLRRNAACMLRWVDISQVFLRSLLPVAEYLPHPHLLFLTITLRLVTTVRKHHIINQLSNTLAVPLVKYATHHALQKRPVLELDRFLFLGLFRFLLFATAGLRLGGFATDEASYVGEGGVEFQRGGFEGATHTTTPNNKMV